MVQKALKMRQLLGSLVLGFSHGCELWKSPSCVRLFATTWTVHGIPQARILELPTFPSPGYLPNPGIEPRDRTQASPHFRQILYHLSYKGSPRILEWVAYPFSSGSSQPRNQPGSPALQADSSPVELSERHKLQSSVNFYNCVLKFQFSKHAQLRGNEFPHRISPRMNQVREYFLSVISG